MIHFLKKHIIVTIILAVIAIGIGVFFYITSTKDDILIDFIVAEKKDIVQEVNVTGRVKPVESVDLAFESSGLVASINASVGETVNRGQVLVQLKNGEKRSELARVEANVKLQVAKLEELKHGPTQEEIDVQKVKVNNAGLLLVEAQRNLVVKLNDVFTKTDDAVRNKIDQFIDNSRGSNPQVSFLIGDSSLEIDIETGRIVVELILNDWSNKLVGLTIESDLVLTVEDVKEKLVIVREFSDNVSLAINSLTASANFSQATIDGYRADVSTARSNISAAFSNISVAEEKVQTAQSSLALEQQELALKIAGTRSEQITAQEAKVEEAEAAVKSAQAEIGKTYLIAPISGVVTKQDAKVGEIVAAQETIITIISEDEFEIEARVPEADIAKINIGDPARVTLDAYGSDVYFSVNVVSIDPAETIVEGVATYKTKFLFGEKDERVRSGMTANIDIKTGERSNVIAIPARAIITQNGAKIVRIVDERGEVKEVPVVTGLRDSNGSVEIIEGIKEGDKVIIFIEE